MAAPTRISIVSPLLHGGGAEYQLQLLIEALRLRGHDEISFLAHQVNSAEALSGVRIVRIGTGSREPRFGYSMHYFSLTDALRRIAPHVIYQRVACGYTGICAWYARRHGARLIWHAAHETDVTPVSLDAGRNAVRRWLEKRSVEYGIRHADRIVVQTGDQARLLERHYGRQADRVVPNFQAPPTETIDKSGPLIVAWIANLKLWKQPEVFIRLAQALADLAGVRFVMVGEAATDWRNSRWTELLLREIRATPNLDFTGRLTQSEVNLLLARTAIFVNTSIHEGFPNTFIQAWMRDAVVVSLTVNPDAVLTKQELGVCAGDELTLQAAVRRLVLDAPLRESYAKRANRYAQERHSLVNAADLVALIDRCVTEVSG